MIRSTVRVSIILGYLLSISLATCASGTQWTTVYDGKTKYTFSVDASSASLPESPLDQATYGSLISQLTVNPTISDSSKGLELLQMAANKVVFSNIDYDSAFPYRDDLYGTQIDGMNIKEFIRVSDFSEKVEKLRDW